MSWHHKLYYLPYCILFWLSSLSLLPKRSLECQNKSPLCVACQFDQAHRRPWQTKEKKSGDGVSVDQIVSAQPGLLPQMSGFLTNERLWGATTFVDHVSDYVYVHLMRDLSLTKTWLAKSAMEKVMAQAGRTVKH